MAGLRLWGEAEMGFIAGDARTQGTLFPVTLEELIPEEHFCRVIDAFVNRLDMQGLGFVRAEAAETGRPGYDPRDLLKLYLYGYLQQIRSSRRLESECRRNLELMWLLGRLCPDHKSIAEFRRMHRHAVTQAGAELVTFARSVGLIRGEWIAIDGSKFRAVSSISSVHERDAMERYLDNPGTDGMFSATLTDVARFARVIVVDVAHHVTQRGNARQFILAGDADRLVYLDLLRRYSQLHQLSLIGYCLMSNHVHLIVVPHRTDALAQGLKHTHGRYASYWNASHTSSGHVWQGRYYSCPLDPAHLWEALRYAELNPVRAGLVAAPEDWRWSSAAVHCGAAKSDTSLELEPWRKRWTVSEWREYLAAGESEADLATLRQCTHTGRPLGSPEFIEALEKSMHRHLAPQKGGRPEKPIADARQHKIIF